MVKILATVERLTEYSAACCDVDKVADVLQEGLELLRKWRLAALPLTTLVGVVGGGWFACV
jgi:hypothetical protein